MKVIINNKKIAEDEIIIIPENSKDKKELAKMRPPYDVSNVNIGENIKNNAISIIFKRDTNGRI